MSANRFATLAVAVAVVVLTTRIPASAQEIVFSSDAQIACDDFTWEDFDVIVDGAIVAIDCAHQFASLTVRNAGLVTHTPGQLSGMHLTITGDLIVDGSSDIDATGLGHLAAAGPGAGGPCSGGPGGGAGHGGRGGFAGGAAGVSGAVYGGFETPGIAGSGGGGCSAGGRGGGVIRLDVGGSARIDGVVSADGQSAIADGGGGSGGSVWLTCTTLIGNGILRARGGAGGGGDVGGGGGSGGRVGVETNDAATFAGDIRADGGDAGGAAVAGGAGSVFVARVGLPSRLVFDNRGRVAGRSELNGSVRIAGDLHLLGGAVLVHAPSTYALALTVDRDVVIAADAAINATGLGFAAASGNGAGGDCAEGPGGGGGHGGAGGDGSGGKPGGLSYGSEIGPYELGSGGGVCGEGGAGGGAVRISAGRDVILDGAILADGADAIGTGGGGGGGSIYLLCAELRGSGEISACGGAGSGGGGGGGGGRLALYRPCGAAETFAGTIRVDGGSGFAVGSAGTIFPSAPTASDCNGNGEPDECDIAAGTSTDGNGNGIPDECEVTLTLTVDNVVGGQSAMFSVAGGVPTTQAVILWGNRDGRYDAVLGPWCVSFWFDVPVDDPQRRIVVRGQFDGSGMYEKSIDIPARFVGRPIRFQAAQSQTCPGVAMSNVIDTVIQ